MCHSQMDLVADEFKEAAEEKTTQVQPPLHPVATLHKLTDRSPDESRISIPLGDSPAFI